MRSNKIWSQEVIWEKRLFVSEIWRVVSQQGALNQIPMDRQFARQWLIKLQLLQLEVSLEVSYLSLMLLGLGCPTGACKEKWT